MIDKKKILKEFEDAFEEYQKEAGFSASLEDLEKEFHLKDYVLQVGFVGVDVGTQIRSRIVEYFRDWLAYLNNLLIPNQGFMAAQTETKLFGSEADKKMIWDLTKIGMKFSTMHSYVGLEADKNLQAKFIDDCLDSWKNKFRPGLVSIMKRTYEGWDKD
jgi:hypothetical protein